ncbi:MAG: thiamine phosphate synthase [Clostridium sp.]
MIYLITNRRLVTEERYLEVIREASYSGVERIILREKDLTANELEKLYYRIRDVITEDTKIIINSNIECAKKVDAYGVHLTFSDFLKYKKVNDIVVGVSIHSIEEGVKAYELGANYILASNIYETECKKGVKGKGVTFLLELKKKINIPIVALGGINTKNIKNIYNNGINNVGIMSGIFLSKDVNEYVSLLK